MSEHRLPWEELSGEKNLEGKYKVSFDIEISADDDINVGDFHNVIASSFSGSDVLNKISKLDLEKADLKQDLKVGDTVRIIDSIEVEAELEYYGGHLIVGWKGDNAGIKPNKLGKIKIQIPKNTIAVVGEISGNEVELTEFEQPFNVSLKNNFTETIEDTLININSIIITNKYVTKVGN